MTIQRYVETRRAYEWGLVCQALAAAMRHVLQASADSRAMQAAGMRHGGWWPGASSCALKTPLSCWLPCRRLMADAEVGSLPVFAGLGADGGAAGAPVAQ